MLIIVCDLQTRCQQNAYLDMTTGAIVTCRLEDENGEARKFYGGPPEGAGVRIPPCPLEGSPKTCQEEKISRSEPRAHRFHEAGRTGTRSPRCGAPRPH